jgi:hypothetical protein
MGSDTTITSQDCQRRTPPSSKGTGGDLGSSRTGRSASAVQNEKVFMLIEGGEKASTGARTAVSCGWVPSAERSKYNVLSTLLTARGSIPDP